MTAKRDLKKRIRERAARTGERYTAARKHVLGAGEPTGGVPFIELRDMSKLAARVGIRCPTYMFPGVADRVDGRALLAHIRDCLRATERDRATDILRAVILDGEQPAIEDSRVSLMLHQVAPILRAISTRQILPTRGDAFFTRARAGIGGISEGGTMLALPFAGKQGLEMIICMIWMTGPLRALAIPARPPSLVLMTAEDVGVSGYPARSG
ncbi:MAG TPA: hypothetical protein VKB80_36715 [Kofleriaceae bacterium]|nr:hypothetical protein [Kofleriaceae bacterium]